MQTLFAWRFLLQLRLIFSCSQCNFSAAPVMTWSRKASQNHRPLPPKCSNSWNGVTLKWLLEVSRVMQVYFRILVGWLTCRSWCRIFLFLFLITVLVCREVFYNVNVCWNTRWINHSRATRCFWKLHQLWAWRQIINGNDQKRAAPMILFPFDLVASAF